MVITIISLSRKQTTVGRDYKLAQQFSLPYCLCSCNFFSLTEAEDIKKRWQEHTEELYKIDLNDLDNHDGVGTHLEPDILKYEVKWALGSIAMNNGGS